MDVDFDPGYDPYLFSEEFSDENTQEMRNLENRDFERRIPDDSYVLTELQNANLSQGKSSFLN